MDQHSQALQWADQNPDDPRAQTIRAKAWAAQNPNDPRSAQIVEKLKQTQDPKANSFQVANSIDEKKGMAAQGADLANLIMKSGPQHNPNLITLDHVKETVDAGTSPTGVNEMAANYAIPRGAGALASKMSEGVGGLKRLLLGAGEGAVSGLAHQPKGEDNMSNRLSNATEGAMMGGAAQGVSEALKAGPAALKSAYRSVMPEGFSAYAANVVKEAPEDAANVAGAAFKAGPRSNSDDYYAAQELLRQSSPKVEDMMGQKASEMTGKAIRDKAFGPSALAAAMSGHPSYVLAPLAAGAAVGGGKEFLRQAAKPTTGATDPKQIASLAAALEGLSAK